MEVELLTSEAVTAALRRELRSLWDDAFDRAFTDEDEQHAFGGVHCLVRDQRRLLAHGSVVPRELLVGWQPRRAGYVEAVATLPQHQGRGLGTQVMTALGEVILAEYAVGALSTPAPLFYERLGWERWRGPSYVVRGSSPTRTEDDDEGLMVLRTARSADLDLRLPIACHDRPGDAW